jgi:hypothetical protein
LRQIISFTPGFSPVLDRDASAENPFQTVVAGKPLKRFLNNVNVSTGLLPGVNETAERFLKLVFIAGNVIRSECLQSCCAVRGLFDSIPRIRWTPLVEKLPRTAGTHRAMRRRFFLRRLPRSIALFTSLLK